MASPMALQLAGLVVLCMVVGAPIAQATITCGQVTASVGSCIAYLKKGGAVPPACCSGMKSLKAAAKTTTDRQAACQCIKSAASSISGLATVLQPGFPSSVASKSLIRSAHQQTVAP